jgi:hypothetical protein
VRRRCVTAKAPSTETYVRLSGYPTTQVRSSERAHASVQQPPTSIRAAGHRERRSSLGAQFAARRIVAQAPEHEPTSGDRGPITADRVLTLRTATPGASAARPGPLEWIPQRCRFDARGELDGGTRPQVGPSRVRRKERRQASRSGDPKAETRPQLAMLTVRPLWGEWTTSWPTPRYIIT